MPSGLPPASMRPTTSQRLHIDHCDIAVGARRHKCARSVRLHQDSRRSHARWPAASLPDASPRRRLRALGPADTSTSLPSAENLSRLAPGTLAARVAVTRLRAMSMMEMVPSPAFATHASLPSGETSKPSITRAHRNHRQQPIAAGRKNRALGNARRWSLPASGRTIQIVTVPEFTLVVNMRRAPGKT